MGNALVIAAIRSSLKVKLAVMAAVLGLAGYGYTRMDGEIKPAAAAAKVGTSEAVATSFKVEGAGKTRGGGLVFLNNFAYAKDRAPQAGDLTVVVQTWKVPSFKDRNVKELVGKTVSARGPVTQYNGKPQIVIDDEKQLVVK